jgi:Protein of unknown function (DUF2934)
MLLSQRLCKTSVPESRLERVVAAFRGTNAMRDTVKSTDKEQPLQLLPDFLGQDRHEFVAKLAYQRWEERGRPFGSPEVDWFAAERAVYSALVASGLVAPSDNDIEHIAEKIYQ